MRCGFGAGDGEVVYGAVDGEFADGAAGKTQRVNDKAVGGEGERGSVNFDVGGVAEASRRSRSK